jgi:hypothetical protein
MTVSKYLRASVAGPNVPFEQAANNFLVNRSTEHMRDLLGDANAAETRVAPLHLDDGCNEFRGRISLTAFAPMGRERNDQAVFSLYLRLGEFE